MRRQLLSVRSAWCRRVGCWRISSVTMDQRIEPNLVPRGSRSCMPRNSRVSRKSQIRGAGLVSREGIRQTSMGDSEASADQQGHRHTEDGVAPAQRRERTDRKRPAGKAQIGEGRSEAIKGRGYDAKQRLSRCDHDQVRCSAGDDCRRHCRVRR
jgi:hypothetical protein